MMLAFLTAVTSRSFSSRRFRAFSMATKWRSIGSDSNTHGRRSSPHLVTTCLRRFLLVRSSISELIWASLTSFRNMGLPLLSGETTMSARSFFTSTFMWVSYFFGMRKVPATTPATTRKNVIRICRLRRVRMTARSFRETVLGGAVGVIEAHFWAEDEEKSEFRRAGPGGQAQTRRSAPLGSSYTTYLFSLFTVSAAP